MPPAPYPKAFPTNAFAFERPGPPRSLYRYAPVFRIRDARGDWVVKRTGNAHSSGAAVAGWTCALRSSGVAVVAPATAFAPNPVTLDDGTTWVVYPYVDGTPYTGTADQLSAAGALLGQIHAAPQGAAAALACIDRSRMPTTDRIARHAAMAAARIRDVGDDPVRFERALAAVAQDPTPIDGLPVVGGSADFKASNLVFAPQPVLVDPDHAACLPRLYDLAIAVLLFHNDCPTAPRRLWTAGEWHCFAYAYLEIVTPMADERRRWGDVLRACWLDQGLWLLANFPEGWQDRHEAAYLRDLATIDSARFALPAPPATRGG